LPERNVNQFFTSTGHSFSTGEWLDLHFYAVEKEYTAMLKSTPIKMGDKILDAGCGNGRFTQKISELVGEDGFVASLDLAPENLSEALRNIRQNHCPCLVVPVRGNVSNLPFDDNVFDGVWCSAVTQFLSEVDFIKTVSEMKRVVRPGGFVAIKEFDGTLFYFSPFEPTLFWKSADLMDDQKKKNFLIRPIQMKSILEDSGFVNVEQQTFIIEKRAPLKEIERNYISAFFEAEDVSWVTLDNIPSEDQIFWRRISDPNSSTYIINNKNFYWREGHVVCTGIVPLDF